MELKLDDKVEVYNDFQKVWRQGYVYATNRTTAIIRVIVVMGKPELIEVSLNALDNPKSNVRRLPKEQWAWPGYCP